jgi:hypothetical protein
VQLNARYLLSLPERSARALFAAAGGTVYESAQLLLPRFVRQSRLYEATAKNALRIAIELLGGVDPMRTAATAPEPGTGRIAARKAAGNIVELGTVTAFGFSPLWLLAGAADVLNGSRLYLRTLEDELTSAGLLRKGVRFTSLDHLMGALASTAGQGARLIDLPPLELEGLKRAIAELRADVSSLPTPAEMAVLFDGLVKTAQGEHRSLLELSSGVGLAFLTSARRLGRDSVIRPYGEDWKPLRDEGFGAYAVRVAGPYRQAIRSHFATDKITVTERLPRYLPRAAAWLRHASRR